MPRLILNVQYMTCAFVQITKKSQAPRVTSFFIFSFKKW